MSVAIQEFMYAVGGNYTKIEPRPPVPGEENEKSNCGASTRSSGSYRSHISSKSLSSGKSMGSHRSSDASHKSTHSPSATPRKSNLDKTLTNSHFNDADSKLNSDDMNAPLGFEPEGSVASSPQFMESSPPAYLKWAENLKYLLEDSEGVKLFKHFLDQEQCSNTLDFWFACSGLKLVPTSDYGLILNLVKLIYKKYVKGDSLRLKSEIKRRIMERLKKNRIDQMIFNEAQAEVENGMCNDSYPVFLKSDTYLQYVQHGGESPKTSNNSSGSDGSRPLLGLLPTVHEDRELKANDIKAIPAESSLSLTESSLLVTRKARERASFLHCERFTPLPSGRVVNPYHVSYAPVTAQDSELQSLSSDAQTDDTTSHTDSSADGRELSAYNKKVGWMKQQKSIQRNAATNNNTDLNQQLIPRTEKAPQDPNLAENNPSKFAAMLLDKLQRIKEEQDMPGRIAETMQRVELTSEQNLLKSSKSSESMQKFSSFPSGLFSSTLVNLDLEDSAQSILEEHVSRVWENPNAVETCRSANASGYTSDEGNFQRFVYPSPNVSSSLFNSSYMKLHHHLCRTREGSMLSSTSTFDSGVVKDDCGIFYHGDCRPPLSHSQARRNYSLVVPDVKGMDSQTCATAHDIHSTSKSKLRQQSISRSDSETWEGQTIRGSNHGYKKVEEMNIDRMSMTGRPFKQEMYFYSQPNLQDATRQRSSRVESLFVVNNRNASMLPPPLPPMELSHLGHPLSSFDAMVDLRQVQSNSSKTLLPTTNSSTVLPSSAPEGGYNPYKPTMECEAISKMGNQSVSSSKPPAPDVTVVGYFFCDEKIPYRTTITGKNITLAQFKQHISKRGNYRYFFKKACDEFDSGVVHEEIFNDSDVLPIWEGKVIGKVERKQ